MPSSNSISNSPLHLTSRPRRLRRTQTLRNMVQETQLTVNDLIYPVFVMEGEGQKEEISSMPDCYRYSLDLLLKEIKDVFALGIKAIALFPLIANDKKDNLGTESYNPDGLVQKTVKAIRQQISEIIVITDVALDPFSIYGHDGLDIIRRLREYTNLPIAAYNVSGEYAMIKAAAQQGWIDRKKIVLETLTSMKRAGADLILTYFAKEVALMLQ
jgi:delta-aminolevulinic acid dehydratase/porphobilinogen synthase